MSMSGFARMASVAARRWLSPLFSARGEDTVKLGLIEPFSGPIAAVGRDTLEIFEFFAGEVNARGGVLGGRHIESRPPRQRP